MNPQKHPKIPKTLNDFLKNREASAQVRARLGNPKDGSYYIGKIAAYYEIDRFLKALEKQQLAQFERANEAESYSGIYGEKL